jgi:hypothetical protein
MDCTKLSDIVSVIDGAGENSQKIVKIRDLICKIIYKNNWR